MEILNRLFETRYLGFIDIEFQTIFTNKQDPYILELGLIIFERGKEHPVFVDHVNFPMLKNMNLRLISSRYSTATEETENKMKEVENNFRININDIEDIKNKKDIIKFVPDKNIKKILKDVVATNNYNIINELTEEKKVRMQKICDQLYFNLFKNRVPNNYLKYYYKILDLYLNDKLVKNRTVNPKNYLNIIKNYFTDMTLVHKENMDIIALNNDLKKYDVKIKHKIYHKDIADYNNFLINKFGSAKLYDNYVHLKNDIILKDNKLKKFEEELLERIKHKMPVIKAHNPLSDCFFTIFVFLLLPQIKSKN